MVSDVLLPFSKFGIVGATLLGLGRALGETIAVLIILSPSDTLWYKILHPGGATVAQTIALLFTSVTRLSESALVLAGLFLFVTVLMTNIAARVIVSRSQARLA
jgi:phosphate transport system permease protein